MKDSITIATELTIDVANSIPSWRKFSFVFILERKSMRENTYKMLSKNGAIDIEFVGETITFNAHSRAVARIFTELGFPKFQGIPSSYFLNRINLRNDRKGFQPLNYWLFNSRTKKSYLSSATPFMVGEKQPKELIITHFVAKKIN